MGCGCKSGSSAKMAIAQGRKTVYTVQVNGETVGEFDTLTEARTEATKVSGLVKVITKAQ